MISNFNTNKLFNCLLIFLIFITLFYSFVIILSSSYNDIIDNINTSIIISIILIIIIAFYFLRIQNINNDKILEKYNIKI